MPTHIGLELTKPKDNWNYTRSTIFTFGLPLWHAGAHLGYSVIPNIFAVNTYLYNGWNTMVDNNFSPTYGLQLKWSPNDKFTWIYNYIGGPEQASDNKNWKQVHETNLTYNLTPTVSLASDFIYGNEKAVTTTGVDADWYGAQVGLYPINF